MSLRDVSLLFFVPQLATHSLRSGPFTSSSLTVPGSPSNTSNPTCRTFEPHMSTSKPTATTCPALAPTPHLSAPEEPQKHRVSHLCIFIIIILLTTLTFRGLRTALTNNHVACPFPLPSKVWPTFDVKRKERGDPPSTLLCNTDVSNPNRTQR
jgi:hypothetical protein